MRNGQNTQRKRISDKISALHRNYGFDKAAEDATTEKEIIEMYRSQLKKIEGNFVKFKNSGAL